MMRDRVFMNDPGSALQTVLTITPKQWLNHYRTKQSPPTNQPQTTNPLTTNWLFWRVS